MLGVRRGQALSMEYMVRRFGATDVITEMEIEYWNPNWKKVVMRQTHRGA